MFDSRRCCINSACCALSVWFSEEMACNITAELALASTLGAETPTRDISTERGAEYVDVLFSVIIATWWDTALLAETLPESTPWTGAGTSRPFFKANIVFLRCSAAMSPSTDSSIPLPDVSISILLWALNDKPLPEADYSHYTILTLNLILG